MLDSGERLTESPIQISTLLLHDRMTKESEVEAQMAQAVVICDFIKIDHQTRLPVLHPLDFKSPVPVL